MIGAAAAIYHYYYKNTKKNLERCEYRLEIPNVGICCGAYSKSKRTDGLHWSHYPLCENKNCPLMHPNLLEGAEL